jgi:hypothetical protein
MKKVPEVLDRITDVVLAYHPKRKAKTNNPKKRKNATRRSS